MSGEIKPPASGPDEQSDGDDLFGKLDSLIQKHQGRASRGLIEGAPVLSEAIEDRSVGSNADLPILRDAVDPGTGVRDRLPRLMAEKRRQLQVALYLRLRQRLDHELDAALADDRRLGAVAVHPAFTRAAQELRAVLPIVVRESVEQVFGLDSLGALLGQSANRDPTDR